MSDSPEHDRGPVARLSSDLIDTAVEHISIHERLMRVRQTVPRIAMVAVAAMVAYFIAHQIVGHPRPFFAPIATVVVLGITLGQGNRRAVQLAFGVALGILVADLVVKLIGTGTWQLGVIVFAGMSLAVFAGGDQMGVIQAANAGVLIAVLANPGDAVGLHRFTDSLIGAATALLFNLVLFPVNPVKLAASALDPAVERLAGVLDAVADALEAQDPKAAAAALARARDLEDHLESMRVAIATSGETARLALIRRGQRETVDRYTRALDQVTRAQRDVAGLARGADRAIRVGDVMPAAVIAGLRDLAEAARHLAGAFADPDERDEVREAALHGAVATTAGLDRTRNLSVSIVVGQARMTAHDFLRATGMSLDEAREEIRDAADVSTQERAAAVAEVVERDGPAAEIEAARPVVDG